MQKKLTAAAVAGAIVLGGGAAVAVPAFAADSSSASPSAPVSRIDAIKNALKGLVGDKTITQDQANKVAETLGQPGALPGALPGGGFHRGQGGWGHGMGLRLMKGEADAASTVLGMSAQDIRAALRSGSTLADLAKKQNKSETDLVNALVDAAKARVDQALKDGKITQARANEIKNNLPARVKSLVDNGRPASSARFSA